MRKSFSIFALATACFATTASAQSEKAPVPVCPAHYEPIGGTLCMQVSNGDVVLPTAQVAATHYTNANCRKGYEILLDNQCMSPSTGDIVFAQETPINVPQTTKK